MTFTQTDTNAVGALNSYVWKLLQVNLGWTVTSNGLVPIVSRQQVPELMETGSPFIVYGSSIHPTNKSLWALRTETIAYNIYATKGSEADTIANMLSVALERQDEAAADVNDFLDKYATHGGIQRHLTFGSISLGLTQKSEPSDEEGGYVDSLVMVEARYTIDPVVQTNGFTYT